ncbi:metal ABC transporter solute-binding protein, Zn/Mn family [Litchfieldia salsa]|uniref:metal ABC transporter solute-binding protein, Zn/Mn family n=1 Tax=Litchfieldia salsa TaxID=930152 RepID=UPI00361FCAF7
MNLKKSSILLTMIIAILLTGCSKEQTATSDDSLLIYTTIYPLEFFTEQIGGDYVSVSSVIPPGADAHTYEPTAKTMTEIAEADGFIYTGIGLEGFVDAAKDSLTKEKVRFITAGEGLEFHSEESQTHDNEESHATEDTHSHDDEESHATEDAHSHDDEESHATEDNHAHDDEESHATEDTHSHDDEESHATEDNHAHDDEESHATEDNHTESHATEDNHDDHNHGDEDPHVWIDPILSITLAENIKNALTELSPENKDVFEQNFLDLKHELEDLDSEFHKLVDEAAHPEILVSHAAYGYWEKRYGIEQISVTGLSPTQEPSQKQLQTIIETAKEHEIKYILFEQNITGKVAEVVKNEIGAEALMIHNLESLTEEDIKNKEDYLSIMHKNIETLRKAMN